MDTIGAGIVDQTDRGPEGIGGWLLVFVIFSILGGLLSVFLGVAFFIGQAGDLDSLSAGAGLLLGALFLVDAVLIIRRKKLARTLSLATCGLMGAIGILAIGILVAGLEKAELAEAIQITRDLVLAILWFLYFLRSRRVKNTLVQ